MKIIFQVPALKLLIDLLDEPVDLDAIKYLSGLVVCIHKDVDLVKKKERHVFQIYCGVPPSRVICFLHILYLVVATA